MKLPPLLMKELYGRDNVSQKRAIAREHRETEKNDPLKRCFSPRWRGTSKLGFLQQGLRWTQLYLTNTYQNLSQLVDELV